MPVEHLTPLGELTNASMASVEQPPKNGSWVAELEDAKLGLANAQPSDKRGAAALGLLGLHVRVCRSLSALRQWERLVAASKKGLKRCTSVVASVAYEAAGAVDVNAVSQFQSDLLDLQAKAQAELSVETDMSKNNKEMIRQAVFKGTHPNQIRFGHDVNKFGNTSAFQEMTLTGDLVGMEAFVARGAALDAPFLNLPVPRSYNCPCHVPPSASALLMICVMIADLTRSEDHSLQSQADFLDRLTECAMQLVRLGADLGRRLTFTNERCSQIFCIPEMDGRRPSRSPP